MNRKKELFWFGFIHACMVISIAVTSYKVIVEDDKGKMVILLQIVILMALYNLATLINYIRNKKEQELEATGVMQFLSSVTIVDDFIRIKNDFSNGKSNEEAILDAINFADKHAVIKTVCGVVCDEEITAITNGLSVTVFVSNPETEHAFRNIPKYWKPHVKVMRNLTT